MMTSLLTKQDIADRLQVSIPTIDRRIADGMPCLKFGRCVRFDWDAVQKWIANQQPAAVDD